MSSELLTFALTVFMGFFAIMNPIANTPVFLGLVGDRDAAERKKIAKTSCLTAFFIVVAFVVLGKYLFELFGITIPAFKITGGILLFHVGFDMLQSKPSKIHSQGNVEPDDGVAISPLAIPILAGPGTIVTAMSNITSGGFIQVAVIIVIFAVMILLTYIAFILSDTIVKKVGEHLIMVIGKIMGLILAIIGTGMAIDGIKLAFNFK
jgi:multiple antibiotic resistance protein